MKRVYKLMLIFILPILVAVAVGIYAYHRYPNAFYGYYLESAKYKDTEDLLNRYMMYNDTYFKEYIKKDITSADGKDLFTLAVFEEFDEIENEDEEKENTMHYNFYIYNIDYENVYRTIPGFDDTKEHKFNGYLPTITLIITDAADEDNKIEIKFSSVALNYTFKDYGFKGVGDTQKYQDGSKMADQYVQIVSIDVAEYEITENVNITIKCADSQYPNEEDTNFEAFNEDKTDFFTNVKKLDTDSNKFNGEELVKAYNGDYKAAGYTKYVIAKWMWWECLVGFVLALIITGSTALVWQSESAKEKKLQEKMQDKK